MVAQCDIISLMPNIIRPKESWKEPQAVKIDNQVYDAIPQEANAASKIISDFHQRLGMPTTPFTESGAKMMDLIISVWQDLYPIEYKVWLDERSEYQLNEMTTFEQVRKRTGRSLASYPYPIFQMMRVCFKGFDPTERKNCLKMVRKWPMFRMANKA